MANKMALKKIWIIVTIVVLVAGMVFLGVFGLNQTPDYKKSYEIRVSVDIDLKGSGEIVKNAAEKYFSEKGVKVASYATQSKDDGSEFIYKLSENPADFNAEDLKSAIQTALNSNAGTSNLVADAEGVYTVLNTAYKDVFGLVIALAVAAVLAFLYILIMEKTASAFSALCGSVVSALLFISVAAIARIPAGIAFTSALALTFALSFVFSAVLVNRFGEIGKTAGNEKTSATEIAAKGVRQGFLRILFTSVAVIVAAACLAICSVNLAFVSLLILAATVTAAFSSLFWTPYLWSLLRKKR